MEPGRYYDKDSGFSIKFPDEWSVREGYQEDEALVESVSPWEDDLDEFADHVSVDVEKLVPEVSLEAYFDETMEYQMDELPGFELRERGDTDLDNTDAMYVVFDFESEGGMVTVLGYATVKGSRGYLISCVAQTSKFHMYEDKFEEVAHSFKFE
jgi:hypothetical protein